MSFVVVDVHWLIVGIRIAIVFTNKMVVLCVLLFD